MSEEVKRLIARERLEERWGDLGACGGCGWHAGLWEHYCDDSMIAEALNENDGVLELNCANQDFGPCGSEVKIFIGEDSNTTVEG